jgi:hypothetical protein
MKRDHIKYYKYLYKCYPLFIWQQCCKCEKDFRREKGWRALTGPWIGGAGVERFLCNKCAPTKKEASKFFVGNEFIPPRPPAPPPPPRKRYVNP